MAPWSLLYFIFPVGSPLRVHSACRSLSAIGTVLALIGAILLGIVGFVWYPVKRLLAGRHSPGAEEEDDESGDDVSVTAERSATRSEEH